jgi:hypothetical protein
LGKHRDVFLQQADFLVVAFLLRQARHVKELFRQGFLFHAAAPLSFPTEVDVLDRSTHPSGERRFYLHTRPERREGSWSCRAFRRSDIFGSHPV